MEVPSRYITSRGNDNASKIDIFVVSSRHIPQYNHHSLSLWSWSPDTVGGFLISTRKLMSSTRVTIACQLKSAQPESSNRRCFGYYNRWVKSTTTANGPTCDPSQGYCIPGINPWIHREYWEFGNRLIAIKISNIQVTSCTFPRG